MIIFYHSKQQLIAIFTLFFLFLPIYCMAENEVVLVVGAPRSGTSCVSGVLDILGVDFGGNFHATSVSQYNEKGDYEDKSFDEFSRAICRDLNLNGHKPRIIDWQNEQKKEECKDKLKKFIKRLKKNSFGVKIPLISLLLPIYLESLQELGYVTKLLIVLRNPDEIAESWHRRWKDPKQIIYATIAKYYFNLIKYSQGYDVLVIYFDDVINNLELVVDEINKFIPDLKSYSQAETQLIDFVDKELKHHNVFKS